MAQRSSPMGPRFSNRVTRSLRSHAADTSRTYAASFSANRRRLADSAQSRAVTLPFGHELGPARKALALEVLMEQVVARRPRLAGLAAQQHARLVRRAPTLAVVAAAAGADQVVPAVAAAAMARDDMVQSEIAGADAAVLAGVMIANEDLAAGEPHARSRPFDHVHQPNDRWPREEPIGGADGDFGVFEHLSLAAVHQDQSSACVAHIQRLVVLVQHQDSAHPLSPSAYQKVRTGLNSPHVLDENDCSGYFSCRGRPANSTYTSSHA